MTVDKEIQRVMRVYPQACQPSAAEAINSDTSFSGARLWRLQTPRGQLCLRSWQGHPTPERLEFIQAVLWHVDQEGFHGVPLPIETQHHHGFVRHAGYLWELSPWLPGAPYLGTGIGPRQLAAAMAALAEFHQATRLFPLDSAARVAAPGILKRHAQLSQLLAGGISDLAAAVGNEGNRFPELAERAEQTFRVFRQAAPQVAGQLAAAVGLSVSIQPCIRDVWKAHILFAGDEVSGIVDFGAMRPENVAADLARLLGSYVGDNSDRRAEGLRAYEAVHELSDQERQLVAVFDTSGVLLSPLQWLTWIFVEARTFDRLDAVLLRYDELMGRMEKLASC